MTAIAACRACESRALEPVLSLGDQPPANALTVSADERVTEHPLEVVLCTACGLAQLSVSLDPGDLFSDYPYFSTFSPTVVANAASITARLIGGLALDARSLAMEIASNDGYLLRNYAERGISVLGIDPAENVAPHAEAVGVPTLTRFFGLEVARGLVAEGRRADVLHANNVLAHVPDVTDFVAGIAMVLAPSGTAVIETPSLLQLVAKLEYDTIYHEHVYYHSLTALTRLFDRHGLAVVDVEHLDIHGGSFRLFVRHAGTDEASAAVRDQLAVEDAFGVATPAFFSGFADRVAALQRQQRSFLDDVRARGESIAGYGAAAKATVLLHAIGADRRDISFVVDRSPHKRGRHLPNTGIPIVDVDALVERRPDYTLVFAWNFAAEIVAQCEAYRRAGGRFVIPVPEVSVVAPL